MRSEGDICHYMWRSSARAHRRCDHPQYCRTAPEKEDSSAKLLESCTGIQDVTPPRQYIKGVAVIGHACRAGNLRHAQTMKRLNAQAYIRITGVAKERRRVDVLASTMYLDIPGGLCFQRTRVCLSCWKRITSQARKDVRQIRGEDKWGS